MRPWEYRALRRQMEDRVHRPALSSFLMDRKLAGDAVGDHEQVAATPRERLREQHVSGYRGQERVVERGYEPKKSRKLMAT